MRLTKKALALTMASCMVLSLAACGGSSSSSTAETTAAAAAETTAAAAEAEAAEVTEAAAAAGIDGEISVFYYTYGDTYISSVRSALDADLDAKGVSYQDYDSNNSQTTQTEQVNTAIAKGTSLLVVNLVDSGSDDAAKNIIDLASAQDIPVIFFNRSVSEEAVSSYDKAVFVGTDYEMAGHMQGEMIGEYLLENYDAVDLNGDGVISYVMFKGQEGNAEAIARTQYGVEDANAVLIAAGKPELSFYDSSNTNLYLVDQDGAWSAAAANNYMQTILSQYSEANGNMVELVIANNDEMAIGAVTALQNGGYNLEDGSATVIPVFGVDATDAAKDAIGKGTMVGTIKQDAEGMAETIAQIVVNYSTGADTFTDVDADNVVGTWRVNIPYATYTGEE
ncbi:MAG: galactose ABC transporter substrate-binding protein [Clostridiales bacterium]|nr:galactose ABC transporter substrate-binding protein [Clostridiales bacterium]